MITYVHLWECLAEFFSEWKVFLDNHFYWPTNALNCIKLNRLKSTWINILKDKEFLIVF